MNLSFKSWFEDTASTAGATTSASMSGATTTASIANYPRPLFSNIVRKDLFNAVIPRKRRRRPARRRHIE